MFAVISRLIGRIARPKVMIGLTLASAAGMGTLWWLYTSALEDASVAEAENSSLRETVKSQSEAQESLRNRMDERETAVFEAQKEKKELNNELQKKTDELKEALSNDSCANTEHPDAVTDSLRF